MKITRGRGRPVGQSDDLTVSEVQKIVSLPDRRSRDGMRDYAVLLMMANTAMRKGELVRMNVGGLVDQGEKKFVIYTGLKKRSKKPYWLRIPVSPQVFEGLMRYVRQEYRTTRVRAEAPLFYTLGKHGPYERRRITPWAIDGIIKKYTKIAGISKRVTPHSFRATYLTQRQHLKIGALLKISGHKDAKGLSPYLRSTAVEVEEAALEHSYS